MHEIIINAIQASNPLRIGAEKDGSKASMAETIEMAVSILKGNGYLNTGGYVIVSAPVLEKTLNEVGESWSSSGLVHAGLHFMVYLVWRSG